MRRDDLDREPIFAPPPGVVPYASQVHGLARIYHAGRNTFSGLRIAAGSEPALREELILLAVAIPLGVFIAPSAGWYVAMIGALLVILAVELLNTAVEKLADHVTPEFHPKIGAVKDVGSAAVFCTLILGGLVWIVAAAERFELLDRARAAVAG
jgi:diacylglycerol kinase (ATP)